MSKHTLKSITELYQDTFYTNDTASIALVASILIGSRLNVPPVWLYLIGPSSGGKSALIECFNKVPFCTQVSDLTANTFLSGMSNHTRETSLLNKLGRTFTILMKDFTTILTKSEETQAAIIAQMREIYDGHITKETGTGITLEWGAKSGPNKGHATFIMASTEAIFTLQDKFSDMGTRATNYILLPQDRKETTRRSLRNNSKLAEKVAYIQDVFYEFVMDKTTNIPDELPYVDPQIEEDLIEVADFTSRCRSVVKRDYRGVKNLALSAEMPARIAKQLLTSTQVLTYTNDGVLEKYLLDAVYKTGLDSIPKQRRLVLEVLAKHQRVTVSGVANKVNYPPDRVKEWLEDLNMFGVCSRVKSGYKEYWELKPEHVQTMKKFDGVVPLGTILESEDEGGEVAGVAGNYEDPDIHYQEKETRVLINEEADKKFNDL